jgi:hypothetical protein
MTRQLLAQFPRTLLVARRGFASSAALRALPGLDDTHTMDKHKKGDHNTPNAEAVKGAKKEKEAAVKRPSDGENHPSQQGPSAGIGMQVLQFCVVKR